MSNQKLNENGFTLVEVVLSILVLCAVGTALFFAIARKTAMETTSNPSTNSSALLAEITNSGSTNFTGWDLKIYEDESGSLNCLAGPQRNKSCASTTFKPGTFPGSLKHDLAQTSLSKYADTCASSVSFGSTYTLVYRGISTTGIDCYAESGQTPLAQDLNKVLAKVSPLS